MPGPQVGGTKKSSPSKISITRVLVFLCHVTEHHRTSRLTAAPRPHPGVLLWVRNPAVAFWLGSPVRLRSPCQPGLPASESCPQETRASPRGPLQGLLDGPRMWRPAPPEPVAPERARKRLACLTRPASWSLCDLLVRRVSLRPAPTRGGEIGLRLLKRGVSENLGMQCKSTQQSSGSAVWRWWLRVPIHTWDHLQLEAGDETHGDRCASSVPGACDHGPPPLLCL